MFLRPFLIGFYLILFSASVYGSNFIGKVIKIRGAVSILEPHTLKAHELTLNEEVKEDSSILTLNGSFAKIELIDQSIISIGPNSKIVISPRPTKDVGVFSLLKGQMRSKINKEGSKDKKDTIFVIKTNTAAIGVRGTEFHTVYNPSNNTTSVLTYEGDVELAKINQEEAINNEGKKENQIEKLFEDHSSTIVKQGQFSGTVNEIEKPTVPIKISQKQFTSLYNNEDIVTKERKDISSETTSGINEDELREQIPQQVSPEGVFDLKTQTVAAKAGGFLDLDSGIYVAPERDAKLDEQNQVYIPNKVGQVDFETGQYRPPNGFVLTADKGFKADEGLLKQLPDDKKEEFLRVEEKLNKNLAYQLSKDQGQELVTDIPDFMLTYEELRNKDQLSIIIAPMFQNIQTKNHVNLQNGYEFKSKNGKMVEAQWSLNNETNVLTKLYFGYKSFDFESEFSFQKNYLKLGMMAQFSFNSNWDLVGGAGFEQDPFLNYSVATSGAISTNLTKVTIPRIFINFLGQFPLQNNWSMAPSLGPFINLNKKFGANRADTSLGVMGSFKFIYWKNFTHRFEIGPFLRLNSGSVVGSGLDYEYSNQMGGLYLVYNYTY